MNGLPVKTSQRFVHDVSLHIGTGPERAEFEARFWTKVKKGNKDECWEWQGAVNKGNYGLVCFGSFLKGTRIRIVAHRIAYLLSGNVIPTGFELDHLCRNRLCVNPRHLETVTASVNGLRGIGIQAKNAQKTHCKRGHPFDLINTRFVRNGRVRSCRICERLLAAKMRLRKKQTK